VARSAPPSDDGSPARLIATMVGVVGILLLGSLAWSAVGALLGAIGSASAALTSAAGPRPVATFTTPVAATPTTIVVLDTPTPVVIAPSPTVEVTQQPTATAQPTTAPTAVAAGRNPWILLPQPQPGAKVSAGTVTLEARGRGDAPITAIGLQLDGGTLPVQMEQRSDSTWRAFTTARVNTGEHTVRATVTDADGRSGSFRWTFTAGSPP
jgi:hypothetical protein